MQAKVNQEGLGLSLCLIPQGLPELFNALRAIAFWASNMASAFGVYFLQ